MRKFKFSRNIFLLLLLIFGVGFYFFYLRPNHNKLDYDALSKSEPYQDKESLQKFIQGKKWFISAKGEHGYIEFWIFHNNGIYEWRNQSDIGIGSKGIWYFIDAQAGLGRLYLVEDNGSKSVIRIKAVNKHLEVDSTAYWAEEILPERADSNFVDRTISIEQIKNELPEFGLLLGSKWIKDNDINKDAIPHELIFYEDGSFYAYYYRNPPCDFKGRWYISSLQPTTGEINLTIKAQNITCDLRGYTEYGMSDHSYTITNTRLGRSNTSFDYNGYQDYHRN